MMKLLFVSLAFGFTFLLFNSCHERGPLFPDPALGLGLRDFSCTEAWIEVQVGNNDKTANIYIKKDDEIIQTIRLGQSDSLFYFDDLQPNTSYKFDAVTYDDGKEIKSNPVSFTTLDTTSHNFTWQTFTFGNYDNSVLYDVAIIDENNIWAVGEIYIEDSSGVVNLYNAVHWNGQSWELQKIKTNACGGVDYPPIKTIFAFSSNDILFAHIDGSISHYDGIEFVNDCSLITQLNGSANKICGISKNDFYVVSGNGFIAHYQNGNWTRIESGTNVDLKSVWGTPDESEILISGYSIDNSKSILIKITNNVANTIWENNIISGTPPYGNIIYSLISYKRNLFISSNLGVFKQEFITPNSVIKKLFTLPRRVYKITGSNINDIYTVGDRSNIWHYNGVSKKELYVNLSVPSPFYSAAVKGNTIVAVGTTVVNSIYHKATIIKGTRN